MSALFHRISKLVPLENSLNGGYKLVVDCLIHVDALQGAAALARVEEGTVNNLLSSPRNINITTDVCRVLSSQLKSNIDDAIRRCRLNSQSAGNGPGEANQRNLRVSY